MVDASLAATGVVLMLLAARVEGGSRGALAAAGGVVLADTVVRVALILAAGESLPVGGVVFKLVVLAFWAHRWVRMGEAARPATPTAAPGIYR